MEKSGARRRYSLSEISESYSQKRGWEKQFPVTAYLIRPLSFLLTFLILPVTHQPTRVVWAGLVVGLSGCAMLVALPELGPWPGLALVALFSTLDAVDGNMARVTRQVSRYGALLDGLVGMIIESSYCFCLGLGLLRATLAARGTLEAGDLAAPLAGAVIIIGWLFGSTISDAYMSKLYESGEGGVGQAPTKAIGSSRFRGNPFYALYINLHTVNFQLALLAAAVLLGKIEVFLYIFALYYVVRPVTIFVYYVNAARRKFS